MGLRMRRLTNVPRGGAATQLAERYRFGGLGTDQPAGSVANGGMIHGSLRLERPWRRAAASPSEVACIVAECPSVQPRSSVAEPRPTSAPATTCCGSRPPTSGAGTGRRWRAMPTRGGRGSSRSTASWPSTRPSGGLPSDGDELIGYARSIDRGGLFELTELFVRPGRQSSGVGRQLLEHAFPLGRGDVRSIIATTDVRATARYYAADTVARFPYFTLTGRPRAGREARRRRASRRPGPIPPPWRRSPRSSAQSSTSRAGPMSCAGSPRPVPATSSSDAARRSALHSSPRAERDRSPRSTKRISPRSSDMSRRSPRVRAPIRSSSRFPASTSRRSAICSGAASTSIRGSTC